MSAAAGSNDVECVLISDEDEDDAATAKVLTNNVKTNFNPSNDIRNTNNSHEQFERSSNDDSEGRRISRRRRNRAENDGNGKFDGHDGPKVNSNAPYASYPNNDKKTTTTENRAETRSRKRERSPSPAVAEVKDAEPIPYKEILPGLEGAAFQSR